MVVFPSARAWSYGGKSSSEDDSSAASRSVNVSSSALQEPLTCAITNFVSFTWESAKEEEYEYFLGVSSKPLKSVSLFGLSHFWFYRSDVVRMTYLRVASSGSMGCRVDLHHQPFMKSLVLPGCSFFSDLTISYNLASSHQAIPRARLKDNPHNLSINQSIPHASGTLIRARHQFRFGAHTLRKEGLRREKCHNTIIQDTTAH